MSFISDPHTAEDIDLHGAGDLLTHVTLTDHQKTAARATLARYGASDLGPMLGLGEVTA